MLELLGCPDDELSVLFVNDAGMAELNGRYRGEEEATDVLAFPMREGRFADLPTGLLGDVVISVETALRQARPRTEKARPPEIRAGSPLGEEALRLLVHGTLHLLGHDHRTQGAGRRMKAEERRCLRALQSRKKTALTAGRTS
ncbi:MAG: rRNA maturation RNase YbeY [Nitrospinota bacterium]